MTVATPIRRILRPRRHRDWTDVAVEYLDQPLRWWGPEAPRHADKLDRKKRAIRLRDGLSDADLIAEVVGMAARRRIQRPAPLYVTGLGGSGSHWLSHMLADAADLVPAGEVYVPRTLRDEIATMSDEDQACVIDAVTLLHAWPRSADVWALGTVNCAAGVRYLADHRRWFPNAVAVHLRRDPRDQVLSVTFRKPAFRAYVDPDAGDEEYLRRMMRRNVTAWRELHDAADRVDLTCRYEDLCTDPAPVLRRIVAALGRPVDEERLARTVTDHDARSIRRSGAPRASNLDEGGRAAPWATATDPARQRTLHAGLIDAICGLGYPPGDCAGTFLPDAALPARTLTTPARLPGLRYQRIAGTWRPLDATRRNVGVEAGIPVLLRIGTHDAVDLRSLRELDPDDVQALCLAGNETIDDDALGHVATLTGLRTLDLAGTAVTDAGLDQLTTLTGLQQIVLAETRTTPRGRGRFAAAMPKVTTWT